jgi:hypothetical protein
MVSIGHQTGVQILQRLKRLARTGHKKENAMRMFCLTLAVVSVMLAAAATVRAQGATARRAATVSPPSSQGFPFGGERQGLGWSPRDGSGPSYGYAYGAGQRQGMGQGPRYGNGPGYGYGYGGGRGGNGAGQRQGMGLGPRYGNGPGYGYGYGGGRGGSGAGQRRGMGVGPRDGRGAGAFGPGWCL